MYDNWTESRGQLDQMLELERAMARQRRQQWNQQQWQRLAGYGKGLQAYLTQSWPWRRHRLAPIRLFKLFHR